MWVLYLLSEGAGFVLMTEKNIVKLRGLLNMQCLFNINITVITAAVSWSEHSRDLRWNQLCWASWVFFFPRSGLCWASVVTRLQQICSECQWGSLGFIVILVLTGAPWQLFLLDCCTCTYVHAPPSHSVCTWGIMKTEEVRMWEEKWRRRRKSAEVHVEHLN